jgi:hypothetical protein
MPAPPPAPLQQFAVVPIVVGSGDLEGLEISLRPGARLIGRIEFEGSEPPLRGGPGRLSGNIRIEPASPSRSWQGRMQVEISEDGTFRTNGLAPGKYVIQTDSMVAGWRLKGASVAGRDLSPLPFEIGAEDVTGVVLTFTNRVSEIGGTISGRPAGGAPVAVFVFPADERLWIDYGGRSGLMRRLEASADGSFGLHTPPGDYRVLATASPVHDLWQEPATLRSLSRVADLVVVHDGSHVRLHLTPREVR